MTILDKIYEVVKTEMKDTGIKQSFIAEKCGFKPFEFSQMINGHRPMRVDDFYKFCRGMEINPNDIFDQVAAQ